MNGPNLNLLGQREPAHYGRTTLADIESAVRAAADAAGLTFSAMQSNAEHVLVDRVQATLDDDVDLILLNPGAFTHTSVALRDAIAAAGTPFYEVHLSNTYAREPFRHTSYFSDLAEGIIVGCGAIGYRLALQAALARRGS